MVEATGDPNLDALQARADDLAARGSQEPGLVGLFNGFRIARLSSTRTSTGPRSGRWEWAITDVFDALQAYLGSYYVNDFNRFGRTWQVNVQADAAVPVGSAETVEQLKVRNADGDMAPLGVVDVRESAGPVTITRYNMFPAATITGSWQPGVGTGTSSARWNGLSDQELPRSMTYEWTELSYLQKQASKIERFSDLRQNPFSAFVLRGGAGLLRAGRPVRELVDAAGGDPGRADVLAECAGGHRALAVWTSTFLCRSASWSWSDWRARTPF